MFGDSSMCLHCWSRDSVSSSSASTFISGLTHCTVESELYSHSHCCMPSLVITVRWMFQPHLYISLQWVFFFLVVPVKWLVIIRHVNRSFYLLTYLLTYLLHSTSFDSCVVQKCVCIIQVIDPLASDLTYLLCLVTPSGAGHRPLFFIQFRLQPLPPSSSSCTWILLSSFLTPDLFFTCSLVTVSSCVVLQCSLQSLCGNAIIISS